MLIWPQKGTKSTKIKFQTCNFKGLQQINIKIPTFYVCINV